jgi:hypothetical protein
MIDDFFLKIWIFEVFLLLLQFLNIYLITIRLYAVGLKPFAPLRWGLLFSYFFQQPSKTRNLQNILTFYFPFFPYFYFGSTRAHQPLFQAAHSEDLNFSLYFYLKFYKTC